MTQEQKARAYDEAIKKAKEIKEKIVHSHLSTESCKAVSEYIDTIIPELAESEDERIRKAALEGIEYLEHKLGWDFIGDTDILNVKEYLERQKEEADRRLEMVEQHCKNVDELGEKIKSLQKKLYGKQKEQKPSEKQDYSGLNDLERAIHRGFLSAGVENVPVTIIKETAQECLLQMKPAEWSEEDEKMLTNMNRYIDAEKLKAELERQKQELKLSIQSQGDYGQSCHIVAYENILSLIISLQQEQPEVDWEKELRNWMVKMDGKYALLTTDYVDQLITDTAKHFYDLRNRALEEAVRHVYESWMGGTMDDVHRDMVELGRVLNARKEE